jgi:hypothetical protein
MRAVALMIPAAIVFAPACAGDDPPRADWQPYFRELAKSYRITIDAEPDRTLELHEPPVLRWSQPVRGGDDGALFVWLRDGRPAVVGTMFCWPHADGFRMVTNEFHSLVTEPLTAEREMESAWAPRDGIAWKEFPEAPEPVETRTGRLAQLRQLASRFRGESVDDTTGQKWELRLLRQPLFRYALPEPEEKVTDGVLDGALFTLASGTDPEILVLVEAREFKGGRDWHWALARFSDRPLKAWLDNQQVWSVERSRPNVSAAYHCFNVDQLLGPPQPETGP